MTSVTPFLSCSNHSHKLHWTGFDKKPVKTSALLPEKRKKEIQETCFSSSFQTMIRNSSLHTSTSSLLLLTHSFCVCLIWVLMECCGGWTNSERMQSQCPCVQTRGRFTFLCVSSVCFHAVQSVTELNLQRNSTESSCVYYAVLSFSLRRSKSEQVLLSTLYICFTL